MRSVDDFAAIRQAHRDGLSIRHTARQLGVGRDTVRKALKHPEPRPYTCSQPRAAPIFGPFRPVVDALLAADETAPRKQRHTAAQVPRRLVAEHGYTGSYDQVRRYLQQRRLDRRATYIPLEHRPGVRAEADFGPVAVDFPDGRRSVPVLLVTRSYSNAPFALALPTERTEAILHGLVEAFAFFGCVPREPWWDNPRTVARLLLRGRERALQPRYAALVSHYCLTPKFCLPRAATEKPRVENRVYDLQRQWATPVPQVADRAALNAHLRHCALAARQRACGAQPETVAVRFERDRAQALPVPARPFDACALQPGQVDKFQTVRFDGNGYSVPRRHAFRAVTVKGYVGRVVVVADGQEVATHPRCYGRRQRLLDPLHFLVTLPHKPAALDQAPVYRDWQLPPAFPALRAELEARLGAARGVRQYIAVLQLLAVHPLQRLEQAITLCQSRGPLDASAITAAAERLARDAPCSARDHGLSPAAPTPVTVQVPLPDLSRFNQFLPPLLQGDDDHERSDAAAAEGQPQAAQAADHAGRA